MTGDAKLELYKGHRDAQEKYVYFLLAAAGAAIGFAVTQTQSAQLTYLKLILLFSTIAWGLSFYFGCRHILESVNILQRNYQLIRIRDGLHPEFPNDPKFVSSISADLEEQSRLSGRHSARQLKLLILGAVLYVFWHAAETGCRTPSIVALYPAVCSSTDVKIPTK